MAASLGIGQAEPRGDGDVSLQDHHRPASSCSDSAQSEDRSQNRLQRPQQDDQPRYADLRPYQIRLEAEGKMQSNRIHAPTPAGAAISSKDYLTALAERERMKTSFSAAIEGIDA